MNMAIPSTEKRALLARLLQERATQQTVQVATTAGQQALWVLQNRYPTCFAYNIAFCSEIRGQLQVPVLRRALQALVQRHPLLRAKFNFHGGKLCQEVAGYRELVWEEIDARGLTREQVDQRLRRDHERPFRLGEECPIRAGVYRTGEQNHILLMDVHHIVFDAWSVWLCAEELIGLYLYELGAGPALKPPQVRFEDHALEQEKRWSGAEGERELAFWKARLAGVDNGVAFPATRNRCERQDPRGASVRFTIDPALSSAARGLATRLSLTPFMLYLGTMMVALHRYTGRTDLTIGCPSNGREQRRKQGVVGYFVNPVVIRSDLAGDPTFNQFAERLRPDVLESLAHQEYPFPTLVEHLNCAREADRTPLFQAMFNYHRPQGLARTLDSAMSGDGWPVAGLHIRHYPINQQEGQFELVLDLLDSGAEMHGVLKYRTDLYDDWFAERLSGHFQNLLRAIVADPHMPLSRLPMLAENEQIEILRAWNPISQQAVPEGCLFQPFVQRAMRTPEATAAIHAMGQISYGELLVRASGLAHELQDLGVGPESCVALCVERSLEMLVCVLGIQLAGGAYVPLDLRSPDERIAGIVKQCKAQVLIARSERAGGLIGCAVHTRVVDTTADIPCAARTPESGVTPENLAYVIFTSGSTGTPKGVMLDHRSALNTVLAINRRFQVTAEDRLIGLSALGFDLSVYDIFGSLAAGATLVIPDHERAADPEHWMHLLRRHGVSIWNSAPIMMEMLAGRLRAQRERLPETLRLVMMSGDWIPLGLPEQIRQHSDGDPRLISLGGATEAAIWSIWFPIGDIDPEWRSIPYGRPLDNQSLYVLDEQLNPVPVGAVGELYIGGAGVARGYLGQPELTAERFIRNPFGGNGDRLYRTGDLGRYFADGKIEFLGRLDAQVKIRGYRVELGEIEVALSRHPEVAEVVVLASELHQGIKDLVAYLVPSRADAVPSQQGLQDHLRQTLPDYMVPLAFVTLDHFPMTPNGKLDRKALPVPQVAGCDPQRVYRGPRSLLERKLCGLWEAVLEVERIGIDDNFFDLGGQSLLAVVLLAKIGEELERELPLEVLVRAHTVAGMAAWLEQDSGDDDLLTPLRRGDAERPLFCVHPVGGNILAYRKLADLLAGRYDIFGLRSLGLRRGEIPLADFSSMVGHYLAAVRKQSPNGPYRLCGWSLGGMIALEMAARLQAEGDEVEVVFMIDSYAHETGRRQVSQAERLEWMARDIAGMGGGGELDVSDLGDAPDPRGRLVERAVERGLLPADVPRDQLERLCRVLDANLQAMFQHQPSAYGGKTVLIHACDLPEDHPAHPTAGWSGIAGDLTHHCVEGDHYSLLQAPYVRGVADLIDSHLNAA